MKCNNLKKHQAILKSTLSFEVLGKRRGQENNFYRMSKIGQKNVEILKLKSG